MKASFKKGTQPQGSNKTKSVHLSIKDGCKERINVVCIFVPMLELKYVVTNFKMLDFYWLRNQNTNSIFVPLDGTQSELPDTIYRIYLSMFVAKLLPF